MTLSHPMRQHLCKQRSSWTTSCSIERPNRKSKNAHDNGVYKYIMTLRRIVVRLSNGKELRFTILNVLHFDNVRKRMSGLLYSIVHMWMCCCSKLICNICIWDLVILRSASGQILMLCKGADSAILDKLGSSNRPVWIWDMTETVVVSSPVTNSN